MNKHRKKKTFFITILRDATNDFTFYLLWFISIFSFFCFMMLVLPANTFLEIFGKIILSLISGFVFLPLMALSFVIIICIIRAIFKMLKGGFV